MVGKKKIGQHLLSSRLINVSQLEAALRLQMQTNDLLGKTLRDLGYVSEEGVARALAEQLDMPFATAAEMEASPENLKLIPLELARKRLIFPLKGDHGGLKLAMANPFDWQAVDEVAFTTGLKVIPALATESSILNALEKHGTLSSTLSRVIQSIGHGSEEDDILGSAAKFGSHGTPINSESDHGLDGTPLVIKLVTSIMSDAAKCRASDVHIEPAETEVSVRYRIDGVLKTIVRYPLYIHDSVVSRIKIVSSLDITNKRLPQDGRTVLQLGDQQMNIRLSTLPSVNGEKVVLRLLDDKVALMPLPDLGLPANVYDRILAILARPQGLLLVTGPTGSGKTTTLYAVLQHFHSDTKNLITVEDPVEYKVPGTTQIGINQAIGLTFASVLRHILRQDPDAIMIGEIRDTDTAEIAVQAALTGHLVLSTLHTNNTVSAVTRLIDLGVSPNLVASSVSGILAQRLIRVICSRCKTEIAPPGIACDLGLEHVTKFYKGVGCPACKSTGFKGRVGVYEYLPLDTEIKRMIVRGAPEGELLETARRNGMVSLIEDARHKIEQGLTTVEEVLSKIPLDEPDDRKPVSAPRSN
jgi:type IV pilus assembly protein PilB